MEWRFSSYSFFCRWLASIPLPLHRPAILSLLVLVFGPCLHPPHPHLHLRRPELSIMPLPPHLVLPELSSTPPPHLWPPNLRLILEFSEYVNK